MLFEDQLAALEADSKKVGTQGGELDFALLLDGLTAEREQGITIDVAYRFFSTDRRKFIVADTPGHEQYTRNMVTGASTADVAVILIDARKGVLTQTRRHSYLVSLIGIRNVVLAINKIDMVGYSREVFERIENEYREFAKRHRHRRYRRIPLSALKGDNVTAAERQHAVVHGPDADGVPRDGRDRRRRRAARPVSHAGAVGQPAEPRLPRLLGPHRRRRRAPGDRVRVLPSGRESTVARIVTQDGDLAAGGRRPVDHAHARRRDRHQPRRRARGRRCAAGDRRPVRGQPRLDERGADAARPAVSDEDRREDGRRDARRAEVQDQRQHARAPRGEDARAERDRRVQPEARSADRVRSLRREPRHRRLHPDRPHDATTRSAPACCTSRCAARRTSTGRRSRSTSAAHAALKAQKPCVVWFTGLSGAGKSTIANLVEKRLHALGRHTYLLDGDNVRHGLNKDLGFTEADRVENIRRVAEVAKLMVDAGLIVLVSFISPFRAERAMARELVEAGEFCEVFVDTPLERRRAARPEGALQEGAARRARRTSPASTRPTSARACGAAHRHDGARSGGCGGRGDRAVAQDEGDRLARPSVPVRSQCGLGGVTLDGRHCRPRRFGCAPLGREGNCKPGRCKQGHRRQRDDEAAKALQE